MSRHVDRWVNSSVAITAGIFIVAAIIGFALLPWGQPGQQFSGLWDAICSAAGLVRGSPPNEPVVQADYQMTRVVVTPQMLSGASAESIGRGATLALRCTMCHGARGMSLANTPNLAGQDPIAIYKQLVDFQTGARKSAIMAPVAVGLSDADMRDLAAYYAYLPRVSPEASASAGEPPRIVANGAPMRSIAPCGACHGTLESKAGAGWLGGQPVVYLRAELDAFATGARHNDIGEQMRNVARGLTHEEIEAAAQYYAKLQ
jgi:cytochrome c553